MRSPNVDNQLIGDRALPERGVIRGRRYWCSSYHGIAGLGRFGLGREGLLLGFTLSLRRFN